MVMSPQAVLFVRGGTNDGDSIPLTEGMTMIGRSEFNDIEIDADGVSRQHAAIRRDSKGFWISDLGSKNGTFVNGDEVANEPRLLANWDRIELGGMETHWVFMESRDTVEIPRPKQD